MKYLNVKKENRPSIQEILKRGQNEEFWKILVESLDENIKNLQAIEDGEDMKELPAERYKLEMELLKAKKYYLKCLKELPDDLIDFLSQPDSAIENFDPYSKE